MPDSSLKERHYPLCPYLGEHCIPAIQCTTEHAPSLHLPLPLDARVLPPRTPTCALLSRPVTSIFRTTAEATSSSPTAKLANPPTLPQGLPWWLSGKEPPANAGDVGSIPGCGRSLGGGHGNPLQYSCLENPMDSGAWWAADHGVAKESDMT